MFIVHVPGAADRAVLRFDALHAGESQSRLLHDNGFGAAAEHLTRSACVTSQASSCNIQLRTKA